MFDRIEKYLKDQIDKVVFIELRKDAHSIEERFSILKDVPVPILFDELVDKIKIETKGNEISLASMARGMIFMIGLESKFKHIEVYKEFLYQFEEKIEDYISYEGLKFTEKGELLNALIYFKALTVLNEDNINGLYNYARGCQDMALEAEEGSEKRNTFMKEAFEMLEIMVEKFPEFSQAYFHLGFHYANHKLFKKAEITWKKCIELGVDEEKEKDILLQLDNLAHYIQYEEGYSYILDNQPELGLEKLKPLEKKYKDWWNLLFFIGLGYRNLGEHQKAIEYFERIKQMMPTQIDVLNELGICYSSIGDFVQAEKNLEKALKLKEDDSEILCNLGMIYMEQGKLGLAREVLGKSMMLNPQDEITRQCMTQLNFLEKNEN